MNISNRFYGQNAVLAMYCGLPIPPPPIWGFVQHAWMPDAPVLPSEILSQRWPMFVYSTRNRDEMIRLGLLSSDEVVAIGSPFLYLLRALDVRDIADRVRPESTIFYPVHGTGDDFDIERHQQIVREIAEREGTDFTVCLHWFDHANHAIRAVYEQRGFRVITHGWGGDPFFYARQLAELLRHGVVWSDSASTAMWHGGAVGLRMQLRTVPEAERADDPQFAMDEWRNRWPALFEDGIGGAEAIELADLELGRENLLEPEALARALGWRGGRRGTVAIASPLIRLRRWMQDLDRARAQGGWVR